MTLTRLGSRLAAMALGTSALGGTCSEAPPWHDVSGTWVNASWGPEGKVTLERSGANAPVDLDVAMAVTSALPTDRTPLPVEGTVCVKEAEGLGLAGTYVIDAARSTWAGSDYGGARLDIVARTSDGRVIEVQQAFMYNARPDVLADAVWVFRSATAEALGAVRFEGLRKDAAVSCP